MAKLIISLLIFIYIIIKLNNSNVFVTSSTLPVNRHLNNHRRCPVHHKHPLCNRYNNNNNNNNNNNHVQSFIKTFKKSQKLHDNLPRNIIYYSNDNNDNNNSNNNHHIRHHKHINNNNNNNNNNNKLTNNHLNQTHNDDHKNHIDSVVCQKCARANKVHVSEEELTELRIEFVKKQILEKLRLKERPKISVDSLPQPLYQGATILNHRKAEHRHLDDYYARTNQRFIFLEEEREECRGVKQGPSMCFSFNTNDDLDHIDVATAELWAYRQADNNTDPKRMQMYVVSELSQKLSEKYLPKVKPLAINSSGVPEGWIKIDIVWPIKNRILHISCPSCEEHSDKALFSTEKFHRPFIVLDTRNRQKQRRQKRNVNCSAGVTECCREKLYISFAEIGWDDWILHPAGYDAYFCRGSCSTAATVAMSNTPHSSILRKYIYQRESNGKPRPLELTPCCTAKQFSSLELLYMDSNRTGTVKTLPNMIIEACGCM